MSKKQLFLIGVSLGHSFSPPFFYNKFKKEKITDYQYDACVLKTIQQVWQCVEEYPDLVGFNVTFPYKEQIIPYLDWIDPLAAQIGAVNVVKVIRTRNHFQMRGYNTDHIGFAATLDAVKKRKGAPFHRALIFGTGGSAKMVAFVLAQQGVEYHFVSRNPDLGFLTYELINQEGMEEYDLLVHCTPVGTFPVVEQMVPIDPQLINSSHTLIDLVYNPKESLFLRKGREAGAITHNGLQMLEVQAEESWKIFSSTSF